MVWCIFCLFFFFLSRYRWETKLKWFYVMLVFFDHCIFPEWDDAVGREKRAGLKKILSILPGLYFFGGVGNGFKYYAFKQSRWKSLCKRTFFLRSRGSVRAGSFWLELMGHCLCSALLRCVRALWPGVPQGIIGSEAKVRHRCADSQDWLKVLVFWVWSLKGGGYENFGIWLVSSDCLSLESSWEPKQAVILIIQT